MKTIVSALLALSVLAGVAATSAKLPRPTIQSLAPQLGGTNSKPNTTSVIRLNEQTSPGVIRGSSLCSSRGSPSHR